MNHRMNKFAADITPDEIKELTRWYHSNTPGVHGADAPTPEEVRKARIERARRLIVAGTSEPPKKTSEPPEKTEEPPKKYTLYDYLLAGGSIGAAGGGVAGALISPKNRIRNALIGAGVGTAAGVGGGWLYEYLKNHPGGKA